MLLCKSYLRKNKKKTKGEENQLSSLSTRTSQKSLLLLHNLRKKFFLFWNYLTLFEAVNFHRNVSSINMKNMKKKEETRKLFLNIYIYNQHKTWTSKWKTPINRIKFRLEYFFFAKNIQKYSEFLLFLSPKENPLLLFFMLIKHHLFFFTDKRSLAQQRKTVT